MNTEATYQSRPAFQLISGLSRFWMAAKHGLSQWLIRMGIALIDEPNSVKHAKRELRASLQTTGPDRWIADNLLQLLAVFSAQGHSGFSSPWCLSMFAKLAAFEPLGPLTGEPVEWLEVSDGVWQNMRCSHVFKQADRFDGQAYDIQGKVFREPTGGTYTNSDSFVPITFPYTPTTEYVDVPASED